MVVHLQLYVEEHTNNQNIYQNNNSIELDFHEEDLIDVWISPRYLGVAVISTASITLLPHMFYLKAVNFLILL